MDKKNQPVFTTDLNTNVQIMENLFKGDNTLVKRYVENRADPFLKFCVLYLQGMVDSKLLNEDVLQPLINVRLEGRPGVLTDILEKQVLYTDCIQKNMDPSGIVKAISCGESVVLANGCRDALVVNTSGWAKRNVAEPEAEKALRGPHEGFNESIMENISMLRRRLKTQELKMEFRTFGVRSQTKGCICYIEGLAKPEILSELKKRLERFSIDATLDANYIKEFISDARYSVVETVGSTERPDVVAAKLLEGRIALMLDGTPVVLTLPHMLTEIFQSADDYYLNFYFASIGRLLRLFGFFLSISVPAIYVSLTCFHHEMLPTPLMISIAMARQNVPLPTVLEMVVMLIMFETLREAGTKMPSSIGQSISIVGALVIGQAAVDARLVSSPVIVIVATAGITGLLVPRIKSGTILMRLLLLCLSSILGMYGYIFGIMGLAIYLLNLRSFGVPIISLSQLKQDAAVRLLRNDMIKRPSDIAANKAGSRFKDGRQ